MRQHPRRLLTTLEYWELGDWDKDPKRWERARKECGKIFEVKSHPFQNVPEEQPPLRN